MLRSCDIALTTDGEVTVMDARMSGRGRRAKRKRGVQESRPRSGGRAAGRRMPAGCQGGPRAARRGGQWGSLPWRLCAAIAASIAGEGAVKEGGGSEREHEVSGGGLLGKPAIARGRCASWWLLSALRPPWQAQAGAPAGREPRGDSEQRSLFWPSFC